MQPTSDINPTKKPVIPLPNGGGIILVDKPRGPSSHQVAAWVREMTGVSQVGHTGTLDPQVSGVLVVLLGKAVRLTSILHLDEKEYICLMRLQGDVSQQDLETAVTEFTGKIYQRPPRRSAVKRALRIREILELEILSREGRQVLLRARCDSGTYIRSLCHHIGMALGVGAHMQELRRSRSADFRESQIHTLHDVRDAVEAAKAGNPDILSGMLLPMENSIKHLPTVTIKDSAAGAICHGARLSMRGIVKTDSFQMEDFVAIFTDSGELIGIGEALMSASRIIPGEKGLAVAPRIIFPDVDAYPAIWKGHSASGETSKA
ncbi:MAG TPA: RNA-guided pseudouridylation complex pseudouridine synthase subunit Cbf5 [Methanospirillum sp.]|uniref:RNA-guided pseudouridylation complex pseudouridine synthase subunit Cbf5 n=1 Tax=Methanospirillum sp. TaxID=45200 RepID=UPI002BCFA5CC|nr:RNA-guided pseudouridylation complex pseudouridine synthase subunit Cbf5 [Methanospirillum sp.]HWQ64763.1 RNA-guided pseudouridylation complex pseudouridine synthase subunit Cbf5 [Methanospirillum sp.]